MFNNLGGKDKGEIRNLKYGKKMLLTYEFECYVTPTVLAHKR